MFASNLLSLKSFCLLTMTGCFIVAMCSQALTSAATLKAPPTSGSVDQPWGKRRGVTPADRTRIARYRKLTWHSSYWTDFKSPAELNEKWIPQEDDKPELKSCRRAHNAQILDQGLTLKTLMAKNCHAKWSTGSVFSNFRQKYGFYEARIEATDTTGINNAFWLTTNDGYEIDIAEIHGPNSVNITLHKWTPSPHHAVGLHNVFTDDLGTGYHDYGVLWTPKELIFEVDGEPINAIVTSGAINGSADIRFSTAVADFAGKTPVHPEYHDMKVRYLHVFPFHPDERISE